MAKAIRSYMNDEITAFQFDDTLTEVSIRTDDKTVQTIARTLWFHYDDCKDHKIFASKEQWDYFNRLLLLLESDAEIETVKSSRKWHPSQAVAALLLLAYVLIAVGVGWGKHLFVYAVPFGPPSMLLAWLNSRRRKKEVSATKIALTPFPSIASLLSVRRSVSGFVRHRYPKAIVERRIRDPLCDKLIRIPWVITWCMFSPIGLFLQILPDRDSKTRIRMPEPSAGAYALPRGAQT